jgi:hypothetical protein
MARGQDVKQRNRERKEAENREEERQVITTFVSS